MRKMILTAALSCFAFPVLAQNAEVCLALRQFEAEVNVTTPRPIDEVTELVQVRVNCELVTLTYVKRLLLTDDELAEGWRERKQRQHIQLHCNNVGLARSDWTVLDLLYDVDFQYLVALKTTPDDCSGS